jgi:hypothetical protein
MKIYLSFNCDSCHASTVDKTGFLAAGTVLLHLQTKIELSKLSVSLVLRGHMIRLSHFNRECSKYFISGHLISVFAMLPGGQINRTATVTPTTPSSNASSSYPPPQPSRVFYDKRTAKSSFQRCLANPRRRFHFQVLLVLACSIAESLILLPSDGCACAVGSFISSYQ